MNEMSDERDLNKSEPEQKPADLPSTTIDSGDEMVVPDISIPKYDTDLKQNELDEIEIHQLPPPTTASDGTASTSEHTDDDRSVQIDGKTTNSTVIDADDETSDKSIGVNNIQDNEISNDDAADRKPWENPMGKISVGRFLKKVTKKE